MTDDIGLCNGCYCMTHTVEDKCGKCGADKTANEASDGVSELIEIEALLNLCEGPSGFITDVLDLIHHRDQRIVAEAEKERSERDNIAYMLGYNDAVENKKARVTAQRDGQGGNNSVA